MKRPTAPFLDNNPRVGFSWDVRKRTSTSNDTNIPVPTKNCSPSLQHRVQESFIRTCESPPLFHRDMEALGEGRGQTM